MKLGPIVFVLAVLGYTGFEVYAVSRNSYRMQPDYIYSQFAAADRAVTACGIDKSSRRARFERNRNYQQARALERLASAEDTDTPAAVRLDAQARAAVDEVNRLIDIEGCDSVSLWKWARRFDLLANHNPPIRD